MSDIQLLLGFEKVDRGKLTREQKEQIMNNIGCLVEFASSASLAAPNCGLADIHVDNLSYIASFAAEIAGELNVLLQT